MPVVKVEGPRITDIEKRRTLVRELTTAATRAFGMPDEKIIVLIRENNPDQVAVGGQLISDRS